MTGPGMGTGLTMGPLVSENMPDSNTYKAFSASEALNVPVSNGAIVELEASYCSKNSDGTVPTTYYFGVGPGTQASYTIGVSYGVGLVWQ